MYLVYYAKEKQTVNYSGTTRIEKSKILDFCQFVVIRMCSGECNWLVYVIRYARKQFLAKIVFLSSRYEKLHYNFVFLPTNVDLIDVRKQWKTVFISNGCAYVHRSTNLYSEHWSSEFLVKKITMLKSKRIDSLLLFHGNWKKYVLSNINTTIHSRWTLNDQYDICNRLRTFWFAWCI